MQCHNQSKGAGGIVTMPVKIALFLYLKEWRLVVSSGRERGVQVQACFNMLFAVAATVRHKLVITIQKAE